MSGGPARRGGVGEEGVGISGSYEAMRLIGTEPYHLALATP